jgi:high-affinity iron transporter
VLATFVIGLREGLEAALIIGIIAAFLRQRGGADLLGRVWGGVALAVGLCLVAAIGLQLVDAKLPKAQQEGLETIVGLAAVGMVSYMIVWMQRHSRSLRSSLEQVTARALASGSAWALVGMAFFAVLREGLETAVFLLATFQASSDGELASLGAVLGIFVAAVLGYALYRGAVRIDLRRFFRGTTLVLVFVAAGLVMASLHAAHNAGWLNVGQAPVVDLRWLVQPGSVQAALLTGMLGLQAQPRVIEVLGWLAYLVVVGGFVLWPRGAAAPRTSRRVAAEA